MSIVCTALAALAFQGIGYRDLPKEPVVAFVDVHVIPMTQPGVLDHQTVIVRGGRIAEIGPATAVKPPASAVTIDGRGRYLIPGLGEMHGHLPDPGAAPELTENALFLYLARGVTILRVLDGTPAHLDLKAKIARGEVLGPALWVAGPTLDSNAVPTPELGRRLVEEQQAIGYDELAIGAGLSPESAAAIKARAKLLGMRIGGDPSLASAGAPPQVLVAVTRDVARYLGAEQEFGGVARGRRADLILLSGNPLADLANVGRRVGVMVNGRWLPEAEIAARLDRIAAAYH